MENKCKCSINKAGEPALLSIIQDDFKVIKVKIYGVIKNRGGDLSGSEKRGREI